MFALLSRLVGKLPVGRKLLLIYLLDLSAVIYVSGILINEKYIAINFARKEVAGNLYIAEVRDVLLAMPVPVVAAQPALTSPPVDKTVLLQSVERLRLAEVAHGDGMASVDTNHALLAALLNVGDQSSWTADTHSEVFDAGRALITRIGNQSNLILDPDLNSYYVMSLLLLRFPEVQELLQRTAQKAAQLVQSPPERRELLLTELLILEGRLDAAAKAVQSDFSEAFAPGPDWLRDEFSPARDALLAQMAAFRIDPKALASLPTAEQGQAVLARHRTALASLQQAWQSATQQMQRLLDERIALLIKRMWLHLGTAAGLLMVLLGLVYFIARQISQPIKRLADVADQVSRTGDHSVRANHDSSDEIGQLVKAFNEMLGQLDHNRATREELAATTRAAEAQRVLVESFPTPLIVTAIPQHQVLHANQPALPWLQGLSTDPWATCLAPGDRARFFQRLADLGAVDGFEVRWQAPAEPGALEQPAAEWALLSARQLSYQGQPALLTAFTPISRQKLLEKRLQLWAKVFEASSESIMIFDADRRILTANQAFCRTTGWDVSDVSGETPEFLYSARHDTAFYATLWQSAVIRGSWQGEIWFKRKNGEVYPTWTVANAVRSPDGRISHLVAASVDISEHKANEARIHHLAHHDVLTDLPNRSLCMERLRLAVAQAERTGQQVGVVFIDLDRFKNINDSMGHHVGDGLLRSVSKRLQQAVRAVDTVSRLGGDEFVVVLAGVESPEEIRHIVMDRMVPLIRQPHVIEGAELSVSCSAGMAVYPQDGRDIDHLMRHADAAMYHAKSAGRNQALFFTAEFHERAQERLNIENAMRDVLVRKELSLHYQPRIDARTGQILGVEALVRWLHPELGMISPGRFIPIAEEIGQISSIGAWILDEACRQHAQWVAQGVGCVPVSINLSAIQLRDPMLPRDLAAMLERHGVPAAAIELELTESFLMENAIATVESLAALKTLGITLSIDDFGTGYSSLNYLHQFPIDKLKIDQSFVRDMLDDPADLAITEAIIGLGHTLGLQVVAEGVEHEAEENLLREAGCDELQGYLFARPMPAEQLVVWLGSHTLAPLRSPTHHRRLPRGRSSLNTPVVVDASPNDLEKAEA